MNLFGAGLRPRLNLPVTYYTLNRLKPREAAAAMRHMEFRAAEIEAVASLVPETQKVVKVLKGAKTNAAKDAYAYLASLPAEVIAFIETELPNPRALSKIRSYLQKWRPLRMSLPSGELDSLGVPRGPKFDKIIEQFFELQLRGKGRTPEDRTKILRQLAGIKDDLKKKPEKEKKKGKETGAASAHNAPAAAHGAPGDKSQDKSHDKKSGRYQPPPAASKPAAGPPSHAAAHAAISSKAQAKQPAKPAAKSAAKAAPAAKSKSAKKRRR
jgi:hypothetical protein